MITIIILGVVGILAIIAELFVPGGVIGIVGAGCIIAAVVLTFAQYGMAAGIIALFGFIALGIVIFILWMKNFDRLPVTKRLILHDKIGDKKVPDPHKALLGQTGVALTDLMPSGRAQFGDEKVDVLSQGPSVEKGHKVEAIGFSGSTVVVRAVS